MEHQTPPVSRKKTPSKYFLVIFACFLAIFSVNAQSVNVKGVVKTIDGQTLLGATIVIKGTTTGTITAASGEFSLDAKEGDILKVTFMGYITEEVIAANSYLTIILKEDVQSLDDVVVIGYGSVKKSDLTGSVAVVKPEDIQGKSASKVSDLLQGRVTGMQIIKTSDDPNSGATVRIRGASSLAGTNSPLVVIDGFPFSNDLGDLKQINPEDIESIEVLKDASSSAIYGSQGANGVILITTKSGKSGKSGIYVKSQLTMGTFDSEFQIWKDPAEMALLSNEGYINAGLSPFYIGAVNTGVYYPSVEEIQSGSWPYYTDWTKEVFRDYTVTKNITVGANGGTDKSGYNISFNYWNELGNLKGNSYDKFNLFASLNQKIRDNILVKLNTNITQTSVVNSDGVEYWRNPLWPVYIDNDKSLGYYSTSLEDVSNPVQKREMITNKGKTLDLITSGLLSWEIFSGMSFNSSLSYKFGTSVSDYYLPDVLDVTYTGIGSIGNYQDSKLSSENYLTYIKEFSNHKVTAMAGWTTERSTYRTSNLLGRNFLNDALTNENLSLAAEDQQFVENALVSTSLESFYGRLNYSYNNKYLMTFTARADGSSKFGANNKWGYFPSGAISWKADQEDFIKSLGFFSTLKPRISFGYTGNQGVSPYQTLARYGEELFFNGTDWVNVIGPGYNEFYGGRFYAWWGIPSKDLKWETTSQFDAGLDVGLFRNRLKFSLDYYYKHTTDLIRRQILPPSSSFDYMSINDGVINNKGVELLVEAVAIDKGKFRFKPTLALSHNKNRVMDIGTSVDAGLTTDYFGVTYLAARNDIDDPFGTSIVSIYAVGEPMLVFYGYKVDGIIQKDEDGLAAGLTGPLAKAGEFKYVDLNEDGVVNDDDKTIIGDPNPDFMGSLNLDFSYARFDISIYLYGVYGNDILNTMKFKTPDETPLRWTIDKPNNDYPSLNVSRGRVNMSDYYITDGSYLKLQNLNIGYTTSIPRLTISSLRIYMNFTNLLTLTGFTGYDPEVGIDGIYWGGKPRMRTSTVGVNVNF